MRFKPDFFAYTPTHQLFIETKTSLCIERHSFETCLALELDGYEVYIVVRSGGVVTWNKPSEIRWQMPHGGGMPFTGHWREPSRITETWTADDVRDAKCRGSGNTFGVIEV